MELSFSAAPTARRRGENSSDIHPALPQDRSRHERIRGRLGDRLKVDPAKAVRMAAEFDVREDPEWPGFGWRPLKVRWTEPPAC